MAENMPKLRRELAQISKKARLTSAVDDVDKIIARLLQARDQIAAEQDPHAASLILTKLQNPVKEGFETVNNDLKSVSKTQREFGKALDRSFPVTALPTDHDAMAEHPALINRAISMHLLREGHFDVARVFMDEAREVEHEETPAAADAADGTPRDEDGDVAMSNAASGDAAGKDSKDSKDSGTAMFAEAIANFTQTESRVLQEKFQLMYSILQSIKSCELGPAIAWAQDNSAALEARGSSIEFEMCKLQYIWLAKARPDIHSTAIRPPGDLVAAVQYAKDNFFRFYARHQHEVDRLAAAIVFAPNLRESPYDSVFSTATAFDELANTFTSEYCALLGLSAESPLYVAATAGTIALPRFVKFIGATRSKGAEWTTTDELAFETPLPDSMIYHPIFVCPVSKEQATEDNPPMRLPCGHVLARESLKNLAKGTKYKCPYCPTEGLWKDVRQILL